MESSGEHLAWKNWRHLSTVFILDFNANGPVSRCTLPRFPCKQEATILSLKISREKNRGPVNMSEVEISRAVGTLPKVSYFRLPKNLQELVDDSFLGKERYGTGLRYFVYSH